MKRQQVNQEKRDGLLILGAGGHGQVVAEAAELMGNWKQIFFLDDSFNEKEVMGDRLVAKINDYNKFNSNDYDAIVAVGNNSVRRKLLLQLKSSGFNVPTIIHPKAFVSKYSIIGSGTVVLANATINTNTKIGDGCIININVTIDHDCVINNWTHVCSASVIRSYAKVGENVNIGAAAYIPAMSIIPDYFQLGEREIF